ncbi:glycosyltransferase family 4 protein [Vibrio sp. SM6]|uniref:Glycosyltransferase family 4 protein n=1 Tax=Vibrio agarilyticus TaxID=2726741 RepID=A0A7X8TRN0_9VIBR|nr:glycosyltransferase [Vibrio agarilyticus]NLS13529.1 glycosyltransferase family 4 protein [Vibrio agarilyticus]
MKIVLSGVNLVEGGPLTVLKDAISSSANCEAITAVVCLVNDASLFGEHKLNPKVRFIEFPIVKRNWAFRVFFEYCYCYFLAMKIKPDFWFSLHDCTPFLPKQVTQSVYCHNPSPFYMPNVFDFRYDLKFVLFTMFYRFLYRININANKYVVVQQSFVRDFIKKMSPDMEVIVSHPLKKQPKEYKCKSKSKSNSIELVHFFYPALARTFKNHMVILEALKIIKSKSPEVLSSIRITLTLQPNGNRFNRFLCKAFSGYDCVDIVGLLSKDEVNTIYADAHALLFPSKLETWGLPLSEAKSFDLPLIVSDLPYAKETIGDYDKVTFFDPNNPRELAKIISDFVAGNINFGVNILKSDSETCTSWAQLYDRLLKK